MKDVYYNLDITSLSSPTCTSPVSGILAPTANNSRNSGVARALFKSFNGPPQPSPSSVICRPPLLPGSRSSQSSYMYACMHVCMCI